MKRWIVPPLAVLTALSLAATAPIACSNQTTILPVKEPDKCTLQVVGLSLMTSDRINPDSAGNTRPVQVRIYQLKADQRFLAAAFQDIWKEDKKTLADDLVKVDEFPVYPLTRTEVKFERDESALFVFVVALFKDYKGRSWHESFELPPAPGKGDCGMQECKGPECDAGGKKAPPILNPKYAIWIDGTRVDRGDDHLEDEYPTHRMREIRLRGTSGAGKATAAGGGGTAQ